MQLNKEKFPIVYAAKHIDSNVLHESSSGGVFTALSDFVLSKEGIIVGACYNYDKHTVEHIICSTKTQRDKMRGSKYLQSDLKETYSLIKEEIQKPLNKSESKPILFVGTPCQVHGLKRYMEVNNIIYNDIYFCDLICHGVPSPKLWKEFITYIENLNGFKTDFVTFKDKRRGWENPSSFAKQTEKEYSIRQYSILFHRHYIMRPSCHKCPYADIKRPSDITIGDFWGIERVMPDFYDSKGVSLVLINNQRGNEIFEAVKHNLEYKSSNTTDCMQPNLERFTEASPQRELFWNDYYKKGIRFVLEKYASLALLSKIRRKLSFTISKLKNKF